MRFDADSWQPALVSIYHVFWPDPVLGRIMLNRFCLKIPYKVFFAKTWTETKLFQKVRVLSSSSAPCLTLPATKRSGQKVLIQLEHIFNVHNLQRTPFVLYWTVRNLFYLTPRFPLRKQNEPHWFINRSAFNETRRVGVDVILLHWQFNQSIMNWSRWVCRSPQLLTITCAF